MDPDVLRERLARGDILDQSGVPQQPGSSYQPDRWLWYFRMVENEAVVPFKMPVLYVDDRLIAVDKPHFLATTPGGRYLYETALTRLRRDFAEDGISPIHRLDRETAGILLFCRDPAARVAFPLAIRQALPAYSNEIVLAIKGTSLASTIAVMDLTGHAKRLMNQNYAIIETFVIAGLLYLLINFTLLSVVHLIERWLKVRR
jgi:23S rRNA-/tRNA-specific pseudouridylate synthase